MSGYYFCHASQVLSYRSYGNLDVLMMALRGCHSRDHVFVRIHGIVSVLIFSSLLMVSLHPLLSLIPTKPLALGSPEDSFPSSLLSLHMLFPEVSTFTLLLYLPILHLWMEFRLEYPIVYLASPFRRFGGDHNLTQSELD